MLWFDQHCSQIDTLALLIYVLEYLYFFLFKQKTAYEMRISDWSSDVCSSDLHGDGLITALTDSWIWQNRNIDQYDHAWLLWYLTQDSAVTLAHRSEHDGLLAQLRRHFPEQIGRAHV